MLSFLANSKVQTQFFPGLNFFTKKAEGKALVLREYWPKHLIPFYCTGVLMDHKCQNCFWYGLISTFELMFQSLVLKLFYSFRKFQFKILHFIPRRGILIDQKCSKVLLFWICLDIHTHIFSFLYLLRFSIKGSIDCFFYLRRPICF